MPYPAAVVAIPLLSGKLEFAIARTLAAQPPFVRKALFGPPPAIDGQVLAGDTAVILRLIELIAAKSLTEGGDIDVSRARARRITNSSTGRQIAMARVENLEIPGPAGPIGARLYGRDATDRPLPMLVYYHGGGWAIGDLDTHDGLCRFLAAAAGVLVLSVDYGLSPEHPFPEPVNDARAAFDWAVAQAPGLGADPTRVAIGGDSAGANMAAVVSRQTRDDGVPEPAMQLLLYPVIDDTQPWPSRALFADGFLLTDDDMSWFKERYLPDPALVTNPNVSPYYVEDLTGLAPAYVATAGFDPLRDEGEAYARKMRDAGVRVGLRRHPGLIHTFGQMTEVSRTARAAMFEAAGALRMGLA